MPESYPPSPFFADDLEELGLGGWGVREAEPEAEEEPLEPPAEEPPVPRRKGRGKARDVVAESVEVVAPAGAPAAAPPLSKASLARFAAKRRELREAGRPEVLSTFADDVLWAYDRLDDPGVTDLDAPSPGAWTQLHYARGDRKGFLGTVLPGVLKSAKREGVEGGRSSSEWERRTVDHLRSMLVSALAESQGVKVTKAGKITGPFMGG